MIKAEIPPKLPVSWVGISNDAEGVEISILIAKYIGLPYECILV